MWIFQKQYFLSVAEFVKVYLQGTMGSEAVLCATRDGATSIIRPGETGAVNIGMGKLVLGRRGVNRGSGLMAILASGLKILHTFIENTGGLDDGGRSTAKLLYCSGLSLCGAGSDCVVRRTRDVRDFFNLQGSVRGLSLTRCFYSVTFRLSPGRSSTASFLHIILGSLCFLTDKGEPPLLLGTVARLELISLTNCVPGLVTYREYKTFRAPVVCFSVRENLLCYSGYTSRGTLFPLRVNIIDTVHRVIFTGVSVLCGFGLSPRTDRSLDCVARGCLTSGASEPFGALSFCCSMGSWL